MAAILERVTKLTQGEYFALALYQIFNGIKSSIIPEDLVLLTRSEQFWKKSAHLPHYHSYRFNHTRLPKEKKKTLEVTKLTSCMNFQMTQAVIKCFGQSTVKTNEEIRTTCSAIYTIK